MSKHYLLPEALRAELLRYLMTRPCGEVMQGVIALQQLKPAPSGTPSPEERDATPEVGLA